MINFINCIYQSIFRFRLTPLVEGGYATVMFMGNANGTINEIYVTYFKGNALRDQLLLYSSTSGNRLVYLSLQNSFDGSGYTLDFMEITTFNTYKIQFLSNGGIRSIDTYFNQGTITPLFYGGYMEFNSTYSFFIHNGDTNDNNVKVLNFNITSTLSDKNTVSQVRTYNIKY
jgi:hypothetical protein